MGNSPVSFGEQPKEERTRKKWSMLHGLKQKWSFIVVLILLRHDPCLCCLLGSHHGMAFLWKIPLSMHWAWMFRTANSDGLPDSLRVKMSTKTTLSALWMSPGKEAGQVVKPRLLSWVHLVWSHLLYQVGMLGTGIWIGTNTAATPTCWMN